MVIPRCNEARQDCPRRAFLFHPIARDRRAKTPPSRQTRQHRGVGLSTEDARQNHVDNLGQQRVEEQIDQTTKHVEYLPSRCRASNPRSPARNVSMPGFIASLGHAVEEIAAQSLPPRVRKRFGAPYGRFLRRFTFNLRKKLAFLPPSPLLADTAAVS